MHFAVWSLQPATRRRARCYGPDSVVREGLGEWWFSWVLDGRALQDVFIVPALDAPAAAGRPSPRYGSTLRRLDNAAGVWRIIRVNPVSGAENHLAGQRTGDRIVMLGEDDGQAIRWSFNEIRH